MRVLIVSDIHSNIVALDAVVADAQGNGPVDRVWCLGDVVGYGPAPMACIERLWEMEALCVCGNHDAGAIGGVDLDAFNPIAAEACRWNGERLSDEARAYLAGLPETLMEDSFTLVHGTPQDPLWEYLAGYAQAVETWNQAPTPNVLVGHTHIQFACEMGQGFRQPGAERLVVSVSRPRLLVNPGSVGQPRDRDPRAAYAVYDAAAATVSLCRATYDVGATQRAMAEVGLPEPLIARLSVGR